MSGIGGLQRCSIKMAHKMTSSECPVSGVDFCCLEIIVCDSVDTMTPKLSLLTEALHFHDCHCCRGSVSFCVSEFPALSFQHCNGDASIGKFALNGAFHDSIIPYILWAWPSTACWGRIRRRLLFMLSCVLYSVSFSLQDDFSLHTERRFTVSPVLPS